MVDLHLNTDRFTVKEINQRFLDAKDISDLCADHRVVAVKSMMGTGKTTAIVNHWRSDHGSTLVLSTRKQYSETAKMVFPECTLYLDLPKGETVTEDGCYIFQYESLHRMSRDLEFDTIIIDEIETLCQNVTCITTNKDNLAANATTLRVLLNRAKQVIVADADLSDRGLNMLRGIFPRAEQMALLCNRCVPEKRVVHVYREDVTDLILKDVEEGRNVLVASASKDAIDALHAELETLHVASKKYTSETDDTSMRDFGDLENVWAGQQAVLFTSKVLVGADFSNPNHFEKVYALGGAGSIVPRNLMQMVFRVRKCVTSVIVLAVPAASRPRKLPPKAAERVVAIESLEDKLRKKFIGGALSWEHLHNWVLEVCAANERERKLCAGCDGFVNEFVKICEERGYEVVHEKNRNVKPRVEREEVFPFDEILARTKLPGAQSLAQLKKKAEETRATAQDKEELKVLEYAAMFAGEKIPVDGRHHAAVSKSLRPFFNLKDLGATATASESYQKAVKDSRKRPMLKEIANSGDWVLANVVVKMICEAIGLRGVTDTTREITTDMIRAAFSALKRIAGSEATRLVKVLPNLASTKVIRNLATHPDGETKDMVRHCNAFVNAILGRAILANLRTVGGSERYVQVNNERTKEYRYTLTFTQLGENFGHTMLDVYNDRRK